MKTEDHKLTASCDNQPGSKEYRAKQKQFVDDGKFAEALQMDIDDIQTKFPGKYDEGISQLKKFYKQKQKLQIITT